MTISIKKLTVIVVVVLVGLMIGSAYLLWFRPTPVEVVDQDPPPPQIVTVAELKPEELVRVYLQTWFRRDFGSQYALLSPTFQATMTRDAFSERMQSELPVIDGLRIMSTRKNSLSETDATMTLAINATVNGGKETPFDVSVPFVKTDVGWRISEIPTLTNKK